MRTNRQTLSKKNSCTEDKQEVNFCPRAWDQEYILHIAQSPFKMMRRNDDSFFHQLTCLSKLVQEVKVAQPNIMKLEFQKNFLRRKSPMPLIKSTLMVGQFGWWLSCMARPAAGQVLKKWRSSNQQEIGKKKRKYDLSWIQFWKDVSTINTICVYTQLNWLRWYYRTDHEWLA